MEETGGEGGRWHTGFAHLVVKLHLTNGSHMHFIQYENALAWTNVLFSSALQHINMSQMYQRRLPELWWHIYSYPCDAFICSNASTHRSQLPSEKYSWRQSGWWWPCGKAVQKNVDNNLNHVRRLHYNANRQADSFIVSRVDRNKLNQFTRPTTDQRYGGIRQ